MRYQAAGYRSATWPWFQIRWAMLLLFVLVFCFGSVANAQPDTTLKQSLPRAGKMKKGLPRGKNWVDLLRDTDHWQFEPEYWKLEDHFLHGAMGREKEHHYCYTKQLYRDFELNVEIRMVGDDDANSGVCIRIHPTNWDNVPGYQVDMGKGYWGSLWEERRGNMIQKFPDSFVSQIVNKNGWNHFYIIAKAHHIQAWLNGVKTIDIVHEAGFADGRIGFQLCHMHNLTTVEVRSLFVRELK